MHQVGVNTLAVSSKYLHVNLPVTSMKSLIMALTKRLLKLVKFYKVT